MTNVPNSCLSRPDDKNGEILFDPGWGVYFAKGVFGAFCAVKKHIGRKKLFAAKKQRRSLKD
jgi:hypothetical protein